MGKYQTSVVYVSLDEKLYWYWICRKHTISIILIVQHIYLYLVPLLHLASISIPTYNFPYLHNFNANQNKLPLIFTTGVRLDILLSVCMVYAVSCYSVPERDSKCKLNEYPMLLSYRIYSWTYVVQCINFNIFFSIHFSGREICGKWFRCKQIWKYLNKNLKALPVLMRLYLYCNFVF